MILLSLLLSAVPVAYDATALPTDSQDSTTPKNVPDLGICAAGKGLLPGGCFFAEWKRPYYCEGDIEIQPGVMKPCLEFRDEVESTRSLWIGRYIPKVHPKVYTNGEVVVTQDLLHFWEPFKRECPACVEVRTLTPDERQIVGPPYTHSVRWVELWSDALPLKGLMDSFAPNRILAFLRPTDLEYEWAEDRNALLVHRTIKQHLIVQDPTPEWAKRALEYNRAFICRAQAIVSKSGLGWKGWMQTHGFVPGDRTPLDMQYTKGLRWATRPYLVETWKGAYGRIMPWDINWDDVFAEEKRRHFEEQRLANELVDAYLGACNGQ